MDVAQRIAQANRDHYPAVAAIMEEVLTGAHGAGAVLPDMCRYHLSTGGKRLRAVVPILLHEALGGTPETVYGFAAACEMLHNATLVHDDLQDGDEQRRGRPTVWHRWGAAQAINLGDAMYYYALACLDHVPGEANRWPLARLLAGQSLRVIEGQAQEFRLKDSGAPSLSRYFEMVEGKTSALFALPMEGAALLAGADRHFRNALRKCARHLGVIFQIQDDLLDIYGDKGRESRGSDIREGKLSALAVYALENAELRDEVRLRDILRRSREETTEHDIRYATELFDRTGARAFCVDEIRRREGAVAALPDLEHAPAARDLITGLTRAFLTPVAHLFPHAQA